MKHIAQLPPLRYEGNEAAKTTLHLFLQIMGKIKLKMTPRKNHWWYITVYPDTQGITTGPVSYRSGMATFTMTLNFLKHRMEVVTSEGDHEHFSLEAGLTVAEFYVKTMKILQDLDSNVKIVDTPYDLGIEKSFSQITTHHHYDPEYTQRLWKVFLWVDDVFKEFSGRFYGKTCPVHLYWHSMDLAVTRFSGKKVPPMPKDARLSDKDAYTHECISFGFWPGDPNTPEPAFYSYTFPAPDGIHKKPLHPETAGWVDANGSQMAVLTYRNLLKEKDPRKQLLAFMEAAYSAGAELANWEVEALRVPELNEL